VREYLIDFIQREYPDHLPHHRADLDRAEPADRSATGGPPVVEGGAAQMETPSTPAA
jgi:hypothetical protein